MIIKVVPWKLKASTLASNSKSPKNYHTAGGPNVRGARAENGSIARPQLPGFPKRIGYCNLQTDRSYVQVSWRRERLNIVSNGCSSLRFPAE